MQTFRRHIDALSPEARREVMDRARRHEASRESGVLRGPDAQVAGTNDHAAGTSPDGAGAPDAPGTPGDGTTGNS